MSRYRPTQATPDLWALRWLKALPHGGQSVRAAFASWVRVSPWRLEAYFRQKMIGSELRGLDPERRIDVQALIVHARASISQGKVVPLPHVLGKGRLAGQRLEFQGGESDGVERAMRIGFVTIAIAAVALAIGLELRKHDARIQRTYVTAAGERRTIRLPDGSLLVLNAESAAKMHFTPSRRDVQLLRGEAFFTIERDPRRPFYAGVADAVVEDVGTAFDARVDSSGATVTVTQGRVRIRAASDVEVARGSASNALILVSGEEAARLSGRGSLVVVSLAPAEVAARIAWTRESSLLHLDGMRLAEAVVEFNRHNRVQLRFTDTQSGQLQLGGAFDIETPRLFASSLGKLGCHVDDRGDEIVISRCSQPRQTAFMPPERGQ